MFGRRKPAAPTVGELSTAGRLARREQQITTVNDLTWALLIAQSAMHADDRVDQLVDVLLDLRRALDLPAPILSPQAPVEPVIPGDEGANAPYPPEVSGGA